MNQEDPVTLFQHQMTRSLAEYRAFLEHPEIANDMKFAMIETANQLWPQWGAEFGPARPTEP